MAMELRCRDLSIDCDAVIRGETSEEVLEKATLHALTAHGLDLSDPQMLEQLRSMIRAA